MKFKGEHTVSSLLTEYFNIYLPITKKMSENTIKSYRSALRTLFRYVEDVHGVPPEKVDFHLLNREILFGYINWLVSDKGCSISTRNHHLSVLISFAEYARAVDYELARKFRNLAVKIPFKRSKRKERSYFTEREVEILLSLPDKSAKLGYRNYVMLVLMYASGMTVKEMCRLKFKHVKNVLNYFDYSDSKAELENKTVYNRIWIAIPDDSGKCRNIPVSKIVSRILNDYILSQSSKYMSENLDGLYFFTTQSGQQMTTSCVEGIFKKYLNIAESLHPELFAGKKYSPYSMRHTTAMHLKGMGVKMKSLMVFLGHKSIHSTEIYYRDLNRSFNRYYDDSDYKTESLLQIVNAWKSKKALQTEKALKAKDTFEDRNSADNWIRKWLVGDLVDFSY